MASAHHRWAAGPAAAVDLLGGEDGGVRPGVALACLTRLGTSALKKLCRKRVLQRAGADEASASLASLAFTEKRAEGVEHTALLSLWRHFRLADGDRSGILEPLLEEWTTCSDPERRNLFLILAASFFDASRANFSACASDVLAGSESEGTRYACVLLLHSIVKETARTHRKTNAEKADCFRELSQTFPDLVAICSRRPCGSASAIPRPAVPTRMVSLASDTILLAVAALASMDQDHGGDPSQALPLPVRVLWERTETLLRLLEMHEEWTAALSSAMPGVLSDSGMVILALEAMRKRVSRMLAFTFREDSEDERHAMTIQAQCWRSWAPLLLFDRRTYLQVARGGGEDETLTLKRATSAIRHAAAAGQATKAKAGDPINTLMINETIFRSVVSMGLVIGLGREESEISETSEEKSDSLGQDRHLEKILDALVGITDSLQLSAVTCGLASRVAAFAAERVARDADDSSAVVDAFVDSVMRSCPSNAPVASAFIETLLTQSEATAGLLVDKIQGHLGQKSDGARVGTALAALGSILSAKAAPNQGLLERTFPEITDLVIHWCSALSVTERVRDQARALLTKLPVAEAVDSLLRTIRSRDEDLPLPCQVLLRFLKQAEPSDYHHIAKRFGSFVVSDRSSAHAERVARLMEELSSDTESGFWPCLLSVLLEASAMDPSNQNFIQMLSALSLQLSNCVDLVRGFVLSSLWDRQGKAAAIASPAPAPPSKPSPPLSLTVFQRLHPLLVLRIVSKHCFDQLVTLGLETRVLADQLVKVSDQDIFGQLIQGMSEEEEDVQVRRVCSELCGKINPNVSFSVLLELLRMAIKDAKLPLARACMYAFCCSFANHARPAPMIFHTKCDLLGKEVLALFKRVYEADTEIENMKAGGSDASVVSQDHRRTQLGCLDCFASIVLLKLRRPHDTSVVDLGTFPFQDIPKHLVSLPREHAGDPSALTKGLGIGSAFDLQTYTFLANALITACPRVGQAGVEAEYAASVLQGIIKRMAFRDKASYAAERSRQEVLSDEILLQIVFVSAYHLPSRVVARYGADLLAMVATSVTRGLPGPVLTAAARVAACLLTKDDLDLGADSAGALGDLERAMRRALGEEDASDELKTICQAVISALSART